MKKKYLIFLMAGVISRLAFSVESAQAPQGMPPGLPVEALNACVSKAAGTVAQFEIQNGPVITGKCQLILMPDQLPAQPKLSLMPGMPPFIPVEAFKACKNQTAGSASQLITPDGQAIKGTCQLVLLPDHPPGPPPEAFNACKGRVTDSPAQFTAPNNLVIKGKCRLILVPDLN
ncbi:MAG: hypothetical protein ACXWIN_02860 [Burkholderiaceae bacterium]